MASRSSALLVLAVLPMVFSLPAIYPYQTYDSLTWDKNPYYSPPFYHELQTPFSRTYQKPYQPFFQPFADNYYQVPDAVEVQALPEFDVRNIEVVDIEPTEVDSNREEEATEPHRQKRSPFFFGRSPSSSSAYSSSGAQSFSGLGVSYTKTHGSSGATGSGGGAGFANSGSKAFAANFGGFSGFGGPTFSSSQSNSNAAAISRPSYYQPWSYFQGR